MGQAAVRGEGFAVFQSWSAQELTDVCDRHRDSSLGFFLDWRTVLLLFDLSERQATELFAACRASPKQKVSFMVLLCGVTVASCVAPFDAKLEVLFHAFGMMDQHHLTGSPPLASTVALRCAWPLHGARARPPA